MKKKLLLSVLMSLGILVVGIGAAYAINTFKANQEGFRPAGEGQAARITMRVEAGMADANSLLIPDDATYPQFSPGGALSFSIQNTSDLPLQVTKIDAVTVTCGTPPNFTQCQVVTSNKNTDGTFTGGGFGSCSQYAKLVAPTSFTNWPTSASGAANRCRCGYHRDRALWATGACRGCLYDDRERIGRGAEQHHAAGEDAHTHRPSGICPAGLGAIDVRVRSRGKRLHRQAASARQHRHRPDMQRGGSFPNLQGFATSRSAGRLCRHSVAATLARAGVGPVVPGHC